MTQAKTKNLLLVVLVCIFFLDLGWWLIDMRLKKNDTVAAPASVETTTVSIINYNFQPRFISVPKGSEVTFINNDSVSQAIASKAAKFDSKELKPGQSFKHTFDQTGTFDLYDSLHPIIKGQITVK